MLFFVERWTLIAGGVVQELNSLAHTHEIPPRDENNRLLWLPWSFIYSEKVTTRLAAAAWRHRIGCSFLSLSLEKCFCFTEISNLNDPHRTEEKYIIIFTRIFTLLQSCDLSLISQSFVRFFGCVSCWTAFLRCSLKVHEIDSHRSRDFSLPPLIGFEYCFSFLFCGLWCLRCVAIFDLWSDSSTSSRVVNPPLSWLEEFRSSFFLVSSV